MNIRSIGLQGKYQRIHKTSLPGTVITNRDYLCTGNMWIEDLIGHSDF